MESEKTERKEDVMEENVSSLIPFSEERGERES